MDTEVQKDNDSWARSNGRWEVELLSNCVLQTLAPEKDTQGSYRLFLAGLLFPVRMQVAML